MALSLLIPHTSPAEILVDAHQAVIDAVKLPFGTPVDCEGEVAARDFMNLSPAQADLKLARINGRANQDHITVHLTGLANPADLKPGQWLKVHGKLADAKSATPSPELSLTVDTTEPITPAPLTPADFVDRLADFEGTAGKPADLVLTSTSLHVTPWPADILGKHVAIRGIVRQTAAGFSIDPKNAADWHLIDPQDMVGKTVTLEGIVRSRNGVWGFKYRDLDMIITDERDHPVVLDGRHHYTRAKVTGLLVNQLRPSLDQISLKTDRDLVPTFVLRRANIEFPAPSPDVEERFRDVYPATRTSSDGLPDLVARDIARHNIIGDETAAHGFVDFNRPVIQSILADPTPEVLNTLAKRMNDPAIKPSMQCVYATMLAAANDPSGRDRLKAAIQKPDADFSSALYCLGAFTTLLPEKSRIKTDAAWAQPLMIDLMSRKDTAPMAVKYSSIPWVLAGSNSPAAADALVAFALSEPDERSSPSLPISSTSSPPAA
jgi:hypothetical protein